MFKGLKIPAAWYLSFLFHLFIISITSVYFSILPIPSQPAFTFLGQILSTQDFIMESSQGHGQSFSKSAEYVPSLEEPGSRRPSEKPLLTKPGLRGTAVWSQKRTLKEVTLDETQEKDEPPSDINIEIPEIKYKPLKLEDE